MGVRLERQIERLSASLWLLPVGLGLVGVVLGVLFPWLEQNDRTARELAVQPVVEALVTSTPDGARTLLGAAAGALATVLGVVFSLTVVTLQLASQQFTPRVLRRFMADKPTQIVLGCFTGTVAYLLLVLRAVESSEDRDPGFVPFFSLFLGIVLTLLCLFLVAYFVHHISRSIQSSFLCSVLASEAAADLGRLELRGDPLPAAEMEGGQVVVRSGSSGYLQLVDAEHLCGAAPEGSVVRVEASTGDFLLAGMPLVSIWPASTVDRSMRRRIERSFRLGRERSTRQDLLFSLRQLVDIALKGLSPSVFDVTTTILAVNELGRLLHDFVRRGPEPLGGHRLVRRGATRVYLPVLGLADFLDHAFGEIVKASADQPRVTLRILELLGEVAEQAPREELRRVLVEAGADFYRLGGGDGLAPESRRALQSRLLWLEEGAMLRTEAHPPGPLVH